MSDGELDVFHLVRLGKWLVDLSSNDISVFFLLLCQARCLVIAYGNG